jgi:hypothetical protein
MRPGRSVLRPYFDINTERPPVLLLKESNQPKQNKDLNGCQNLSEVHPNFHFRQQEDATLRTV